MAIRFKYNAAAVASPSNDSTRKFGQSLVLQQQQQKYAAQQAANDRLFSAMKQQQPVRNNWQWGGNAQPGRQQAGGIIQQGGQQRGFGLTTTVDAQKQAMADAEQRKKDFEAARSRIDTHAKDMLENGNITDRETQNKIRNLIAGKAIVMGSGFNETAQKEYLDQYNSELAKILSEVPPPKAPPTRDEELKGFLGSNYDKYKDQPWVPDGKGGFTIADIPAPEPTPPTSVSEAFKDQKTKDKYESDADAYLMGEDGERPSSGKKDAEGNDIPMTDTEYRKARNKLAVELWSTDQASYAAPEPAKPTGFGSSSAAYYNAPDSKSDYQSAPSAGIPITPPDPGRPPAPPQQALPSAAASGKEPLPLTSNSTSQNPWADVVVPEQQLQGPPTDTQAPYSSAEEYDAQMKSKGYKLVTPSDGGRPYYLGDWDAPLREADAANAPQASPAGTGTPAPAATGELPKVAPPDFGKLVSSATDDNEKAVISQIQGLVSQHADSPDVVNALNVFVSPGSSKEDRLAAFDYLITVGIDLNQMIAEEPSRAEKIRGVQDKNKERFGNSRDLLNGM